MGLAIIILANLFLVFVNSSQKELVIKSFIKIIKDKVIKLVLSGMILILLLIIYSPLSKILKLTSLSFKQSLLVIILSNISVFWFEMIKVLNKKLDK